MFLGVIIICNSIQEIERHFPDLLRRTQSDRLRSYLETVVCNVEIEDTETRVHCHYINLDGNKRPRVNDFARLVRNSIIDFALPRNEIRQAIANSNDTMAAYPMAVLFNKAKNLFTKQPNSGEGGEVILSIMAETFLGLPQIFTKMALKTNTEMHIHGSDGIHVGVNEDNGKLALYWGESKLYKNATNAIDNCFNSIAPFLLGQGGSSSTQERELQLMRDGLQLNNPDLVNALKQYLDPDDPLFNKMEYRGLCLIGFDSKCYPETANTKNTETVRQEIEEAFEANKTRILNNVKTKRIHTFVIEVFCLPFPSVEDFRNAFRRELGFNDE